MRKRILWISLAITIAGIIVITLICNDVYYENSLDKTENFLKVYASVFDDRENFDYDYCVELSRSLDGARVTFMDAGGKVVADSVDNTIAGTEHINREEVISAVRNGSGFAVRSSQSVGTDMAYYCVKQADGSLVRISVNVKSNWSLLAEALPILVWFIIVDVVLCLLFTYLATVYILRPVKQLADDAAHYKKLETKYSELRPVAEVMNSMNADIKCKIAELNKEREVVEKARLSKDEFVANVTHEMNTPLTSIRGFAELIASGSLDAAQTAKAATTITAQSERLTNLVTCIINYTQIENDFLPDYEVDLSAMTEEAVRSLAPAMQEKNLSLEMSVQSGVIVSARTEYINEILGNLLRNAIRYNRENGSVSVTVTGGETPALRVSDTGVGIAEENLDRIFDRFFTVDKSHNGKNGGFGLGLAVVKKICAKEGWRLQVESTLNEGSEFTVTFSE